MTRPQRLLALLVCLGLFGHPVACGEPPAGKAVRTDQYGDPLPEGAVSRVGTTRLRHAGDVFSALFTPDGKSLIASDAGLICVYDPKTGARLRSFTGHPNGGEVLGLSPDGKTLAGIGEAYSVYLWDLATGRFLREFGKHEPDEESNLIQLAFAPDGKTLATIGCDSGIQLWDTATGKRLRRLAGEDTGWSVAFSPDGKFLAAGGAKGLQLWDLATDKRLWDIKHQRPRLIHAVVFSPDGKLLAAGDDTGKVSVVGSADGKELRRWKAHAKADEYHHGTQSLAFSPDGKTLASGGDNGQIYLWDPLTGENVRALRGHLSAVYSITFSPDGRALASASHDQTVRLWDTTTGRERPTFDGHQDMVCSLAFSPEGKVLASGGRDDTVRLWDPERGKELQLLSGYDAAFYSPDGKLLACSGGAGVIHLRDSATGRLLHSLEGHEGQRMLFQPDSRTLLTAGLGPVIRAWDVEIGKERRRLTPGGRPKGIGATAFSPDGNWIACAREDETICLLDWAAGREVRRLAGGKETTRCLAFAPDSSCLASGGKPGVVRFWRAADGQQRLHWESPHRSVDAMAFSPDGRFLATGGGYESDVFLWEVATGKEMSRLAGHRGGVRALAFSPDGWRLASGGFDFTVLVWDTSAALGKDSAHPSDLEQCWKDLGTITPRVAYRAVWRLANVPAESVPFLRARMQPVPVVPQARLDRLLADLDDNDFAVRSKATAALEELGELAEPSLRKVLHDSPSEEVRQRAEKLIAAIAVPVPPAEQLRFLRALAVLEEIGTPEARRLLESLASGAPEARLSREARTVCDRLTRRAQQRQPGAATRP